MAGGSLDLTLPALPSSSCLLKQALSGLEGNPRSLPSSGLPPSCCSEPPPSADGNCTLPVSQANARLWSKSFFNELIYLLKNPTGNLHNFSRIHPFLSTSTAQLGPRGITLSCLDYCCPHPLMIWSQTLKPRQTMPHPCPKAQPPPPHPR